MRRYYEYSDKVEPGRLVVEKLRQLREEVSQRAAVDVTQEEEPAVAVEEADKDQPGQQQTSDEVDAASLML